MTHCHSDDDLLEQVAKGDRRAFQVLMERHARVMLALAQRISGNPDDAEELVQDAFLKVWTLAPKWRRDGKAQFSTWLHRVVLNGCLDRRRRPSWTGLDDMEELADSAPGAAQNLALQRSKRMIQEAMATIPDRQRAALFLHYFSEISAPQAAQVLEISVAAMEALLIRGKRALKKELMRRGITDLGDML
jgi:RNA polymerase sigma-70 factor (ECF subfamily)